MKTITENASNSVEAKTARRYSWLPWKDSGTKGFEKRFLQLGETFTTTFVKSLPEYRGTYRTAPRRRKFIKKLSLHDYDAFELGSEGVKVSAQLMGSNAELLELAAKELASEGEAPRVDLNCGCPANVVTGKGAGSSLLLDPNLVYECMRSVKNGCEGYPAVPSLKMRVGFDDASLFRENVQAACEGGAEILTVHGRTKKQGYRGEADWEKIAEAKSICEKFGVMVVGNGDVTSCERAARILRETNCDGVMIGRGAVQDPLLFRRIKSRVRRDASGTVTLFSEEEVSEEHKMEDEAERVHSFSSSVL
jgi:tRNA-dihydrouridine synthase C